MVEHGHTRALHRVLRHAKLLEEGTDSNFGAANLVVGGLMVVGVHPRGIPSATALVQGQGLQCEGGTAYHLDGGLPATREAGLVIDGGPDLGVTLCVQVVHARDLCPLDLARAPCHTRRTRDTLVVAVALELPVAQEVPAETTFVTADLDHLETRQKGIAARFTLIYFNYVW